MSQSIPIPGAVKSDVRDGMQIDWDVPIPMDDGWSFAPTCTGPPAAALIP